jgi:hypothetical protein
MNGTVALFSAGSARGQPGGGMGMRGGGGSLHEINLRQGRAVRLLDEVTEGALQFQGFGGEGADGLNATGGNRTGNPSRGL